MNTKNKQKVFVAMSGGVDSSVAALLLQKEGYDVVGVFMKNWSDSRFFKDKTMCPWVKDQEDARRVAALLNIPFYVFNFEKEYREKVVNYMVEGYKKGITPNPDIMCNKEIKFGLFFEKAMTLGADYIATGHHVKRVTCNVKQKDYDICYMLHVARDTNKDQSYFLWTLTQKQLSKSLFPIGDYTKTQVREIAKEAGMHIADKKDSQGVCFVGEIDVFTFLKSEIKTHKGKILTTDGIQVGEHEGIEFYTIGQRHGIGSPGGGTPYYVAKKDIQKNILYVAEGDADKNLYKNKLEAIDVYWVDGIMPKKCLARIRYRQPLQDCEIVSIHAGKIQVTFKKPQRAVTSGQSIVFYEDEVLLGGAIIKM